MTKAVAYVYYRTRPSEPEASDLALRLQREAVQKEVESGFDLVTEFIEREGEEGSETYPAYTAAVRAASAHSAESAVIFIIASRAAIGSGDVFREPDLRVEGGGFIILWDELLTPSIPARPEIALPAGAPGPLCLYGDYRPRQIDSLVYLCNAGPDPLVDVAVATECIPTGDFYSTEPSERWTEHVHRTPEERWESIPAGTCVLVNVVEQVFQALVCRYLVTFTDAQGRRLTVEAHDASLSDSTLREGEGRWVALRAAS